MKRALARILRTPARRRHALVGPAELWRMKREFQIGFLKTHGLQPHHVLLDVGCGTLRGGIPIIEYLEAGHYVGVEARASVLDEAAGELRESGLADRRPTLLVAEDLTELELARDFDFVWAFSVLIHMTDEILDRTLAFVASHLSEAGCFYANVNLGDRAAGSWQGFPVVHRPLEFYQAACARHGLALSDLGFLSELGHRSGNRAQDSQHMLRIESARSA